MYEADGIDLTRTEYKKLKLLRRAEARNRLDEFIGHELFDGQSIRLFPDEEKSKVYYSLYEKGLVDGSVMVGTLFCPKCLTYRGRDWLKDRRRAAFDEWVRTWLPSIVSAVIGVGGTLLGVMLGTMLEQR